MTKATEKDLKALKKLSKASERTFYLWVNLPSGKTKIEDLTEEELIEVCYLLKHERDSIDETFRKSLITLSEFSSVKKGKTT